MKVDAQKIIEHKNSKGGGFTFSLLHKGIPILMVVIAFFTSSNKYAWFCGYDVGMCGSPLFYIGKIPMYNPFLFLMALVANMMHNDAAMREPTYFCCKMFCFQVLAALLLFFLLSILRGIFFKEDVDLLAHSRWLQNKELKTAGLTAEKGVVLGMQNTAVTQCDSSHGSANIKVIKPAPLLMYDTTVSCAVTAASRSGKGTNMIIPTLFMYPHSIIVFDPKAENFDITAGWRSRFSYIYRLSPVSADDNTLHFNFLDEIEENTAFRDANLLADIIVSPADGKQPSDPHWTDTARALITMAILHCKCSDYQNKSLPGVYDFLTQGGKNAGPKEDMRKKLLQNVIQAQHCSPTIHQEVISYAYQLLQAAPDELGSIFSSAVTKMTVFNDPFVRKTSSQSDFCLDDFKLSELPISLYLTVPHSDAERLSSYFRMLIIFILRKFSGGETKYGNESLKNRILVILDEAATIGTIQDIETMMGILNGYGISFLLVFQSRLQIQKLYGDKAVLLEHCKYIVTYAMSDPSSAEFYSKLCGEQGITKQNMSNSGNRYDFTMNNVSISTDVTKRNLMNPDDIEHLDQGLGLCFSQGTYPYLFKKTAYYCDPRFKDKMNLPYPDTRAKLLKECRNSFVSDPGSKHWYDLSDNYFYPEEQSEFNTKVAVSSETADEDGTPDMNGKDIGFMV